MINNQLIISSCSRSAQNVPLIEGESTVRFVHVRDLYADNPTDMGQAAITTDDHERYYALVEHMLIRVGDDEYGEETSLYRVFWNYRSCYL